jgi:hypothetical protein
MTLISTRRRATGAGVATGALVASALLFAPSAQAADTITNVREADIAASGATPSAGWHQAVAGGKYQVVNAGLALIDSSRVIKGATDVSATGLTEDNGDLEKLGDASITVVDTGKVSLQVELYQTVDGQPVLTTLSSPANGSDEIDLTDVWSTDKAVGTIAANGTAPISDFIAQIPAYKVVGVGVASTSGTNVVKNVAFGGSQYTFGNNAPVAKNRTYSTKIDKAVTVNLASTDVDGNPLTYENVTVDSGTLSGTGETRTFTPAKGFKGTASIKYSVNDQRGGTSSGTITVNVVKLKGAVSIYRVHPSKPSVRSTVYVYATVKTDGKNASKGSTVYVYAKGKRVGVSKVNSVGKVKVKLPNKLPYGKATLKVTQAGSSKLSGGTDSVAVRVRK